MRADLLRQGGLAVALVVSLAASAPASVASAQQGASVEQLAGVIAAEDARNFQPALFRSALVAPDSLVRRLAAVAAGRIRDPRAVPILVPLLSDPDSTVRVSAAFALGLVGDSAGARPLMERITGVPALDGPTALEAVTALAKIGGPAVGRFFDGVIGGGIVATGENRRALVTQIVLESWRLGPDAPVVALLPLLEDSTPAIRWRAAYTLGRLRAPGAANRLTLALGDPEAIVRAMAARGLVRGYVDSAGLAPKAVARLLARSAADPNVQVRINALRSLAGYADSSLTTEIVPLLDDPTPNVQVQAAQTAGMLGGAEAARALARIAGGKGVFGVRREALVGLARVDSAAFQAARGRWRTSADWRERAAAAEGSATAGPGARPWFVSDRDSRVVAAGIQAWNAAVEGPDADLVAAARGLMQHADAAVRSVAADAVSRAASLDDLSLLVAAYRRTSRDSFPDAALAALGAILEIRGGSPDAQARVDREFLGFRPTAR